MLWTILILVVVIFVVLIAIASWKANEEKEYEKKMEATLIENGFTISKIYHDGNNHFAIDDNNKMLFFETKHLKEKFINYSDIVAFELVDDSNILTKNSTGKAIAGAALFGVAGAVVGSSMKKQKNMCTSMVLYITINNVIDPNIKYELIKPLFNGEGYERSGIVYKSAYDFAKSITSTLNVIIEQNKAKIY